MPLSSKSVDVDTGLHTLSPEWLDALRKVVPRRRHPKLPYIVAVGLLAVLGTFAADPSARDLLGARLLPKQAEEPRVGPVETVKAPVVAAPLPGADGVIAKPTENQASAVSEPASPSAPVARPKKKVARPHPAARH